MSVPGTAIWIPGRSLDSHAPPGHDHGAILIPHAAPGRQQCVLVEEEAVGMNADRGDFEFAIERAAVERLDVLKFVDETGGSRWGSCRSPGRGT